MAKLTEKLLISCFRPLLTYSLLGLKISILSPLLSVHSSCTHWSFERGQNLSTAASFPPRLLQPRWAPGVWPGKPSLRARLQWDCQGQHARQGVSANLRHRDFTAPEKALYPLSNRWLNIKQLGLGARFITRTDKFQQLQNFNWSLTCFSLFLFPS